MLRTDRNREHLRECYLAVIDRPLVLFGPISEMPKRNITVVRDGDRLGDVYCLRRVWSFISRENDVFWVVVPEIVHEEDVTRGVPNNPVGRIAE